ncbi:MAG: pyridoxamine kinase [Acutalibacteraceae bacterium]
MNENRLPAAICVNDLSGVGRASLTIALPVLSAMGVQCCPLPTAILSAQTGYTHYSFFDFTPYMREYFQCWQKENFQFDALYTGFLGSAEQIGIVREMAALLPESTLLLTDPVMADNGHVYATYTPEMCHGMKELVAAADIVTPNITEACILTDTPYMGEALSREQALALCRGVAALGAKNVVLTGVHTSPDQIGNYLYTVLTDTLTLIEKPCSAGRYPGTGDLFASVLCGGLLRKEPLEKAVDRAAEFVSAATRYTRQRGADPKDGVLFEPCLKNLTE